MLGQSLSHTVSSRIRIVTISTTLTSAATEGEQDRKLAIARRALTLKVKWANLVIGAATELIAFVADGAEEGGIEFVHSHSLALTTDI